MVHKIMDFRCGDNSGAKFLRCIQIYGHSNKNYATMGRFVRVVARRVDLKKKVKKKKHYLGLAIITKSLITRLDGVQVRGNKNKMIIFNESGKFLGTRVYGFSFKESIYTTLTLSKIPKELKYISKQL